MATQQTSQLPAVEDRAEPWDMTDSEKLTELIITTRELEKAIVGLARNPMVKAMLPKGIV